MAFLLFLIALLGAPVFASGCLLAYFGHPFIGALLIVYSFFKSN